MLEGNLSEKGYSQNILIKKLWGKAMRGKAKAEAREEQ